MEDVARAARCSRSSVSLALRHHPSIPTATRERILRVAETLGYRTNPLVSALMTSRRNRRFAANPTIAVITSHELDSPSRDLGFYRAQLEGVATRAASLGFALERFDLKSPGMTPARLRQILSTRNIRGLVVAPLPRNETSLDFDFSGFAVAALGLSLRKPVVTRIANDLFKAAIRAVSECIKLGYRRIGFIASRQASLRLEYRWLAGYQFALEHHGLTGQPAPLQPDRLEHAARQITPWLIRERPDVVILGHAEREIQARIVAPIGRVLLGVDTATDTSTGIYQNYSELGRVALELVVNKLYTNSFAPLSQPHTHTIEGTWVRGTTALGPPRRR